MKITMKSHSLKYDELKGNVKVEVEIQSLGDSESVKDVAEEFVKRVDAMANIEAPSKGYLQQFSMPQYILEEWQLRSLLVDRAALIVGYDSQLPELPIDEVVENLLSEYALSKIEPTYKNPDWDKVTIDNDSEDDEDIEEFDFEGIEFKESEQETQESEEE